ncbi:MAG: repair protein RecO, repair protein RecO [Candidatus Nomurabacteria bacterium]|nr:repair protein RecO, repair protein RecO [Candidatus Nomurabacteria bacterium]
MAIEKHTTESIVIDAFDQGEHDRVIKLFTREFGMVMVHARSIRKLASKLRAHVLPGRVGLVTLVKGKEVWRLVGAENQKAKGEAVQEAIKIIRRLIRGEGEHKILYDRLGEFFQKFTTYEPSKAKVLLYYIILVDLGYADIKAIGAKNMKEYISWSMDDIYTHLTLAYKDVHSHVSLVLKEIQL